MQMKRHTGYNVVREGRHFICLQTHPPLFNVGTSSVSRTAGQTTPTWRQALQLMRPGHSSAQLLSRAREWISDPQGERRLSELPKLRAQVGLFLYRQQPVLGKKALRKTQYN
jgi:hypothetical protein